MCPANAGRAWPWPIPEVLLGVHPLEYPLLGCPGLVRERRQVMPLFRGIQINWHGEPPKERLPALEAIEKLENSCAADAPRPRRGIELADRRPAVRPVVRPTLRVAACPHTAYQ